MAGKGHGSSRRAVNRTSNTPLARISLSKLANLRKDLKRLNQTRHGSNKMSPELILKELITLGEKHGIPLQRIIEGELSEPLKGEIMAYANNLASRRARATRRLQERPR